LLQAGEGKSSLLAYSFGEPLSPILSENIIPVQVEMALDMRIPIGSAKDLVTSDLYGFYRHLLRAVSKRIEKLGVSSQAENDLRRVIKQTSGAKKQITTSIQVGGPTRPHATSHTRPIRYPGWTLQMTVPQGLRLMSVGGA
jgi:hypothetical protein